ncbi:MAG: hypothetical protein U9N79_11145 [Actinomycetota bacterium]|nr:hypothetical protein [Actinomycetota bacterium]
MTGLALGIVFGVIGIVIALISVVVAKRRLAQTNAEWQSAAETLGFSFEAGSMSGGPTITGSMDTHPATVHTYVKKSGRSSTRYTRYTVGFPAIGIGLQLSRQAGIGQFLKILGAQDIVIGDPTFDEAFIVKASNPQAARAVLTRGRTMALNQLLAVHPDVVVGDDNIAIDRRGGVHDAGVIVSTLRRIASVADALSDAGTSNELTSLIDQRLEGTLPSDYEPEPEPPSGIDARISIGESLAAAGIVDIARKVFDALAVELPADRDITGWSEQVGRGTSTSGSAVEPAVPIPRRDSERILPDESVETDPPPANEPVRIAGRSIGQDAVAIATDLFGENRLSFETAALFDERYADRSVLWSGKVRTATIVDHYRVLGDGPFTKAVVDIAQLENDLFGNTVVSAIVAFPSGSIDSLEVGEEVTFSGRLAGIDALVRNLFVAEGNRVDQ